MGVIIGPIVLPDDDVLIEEPKTDYWSAVTGVVRNTPYTNGALRDYNELYVVNDKFNTEYGGWKHTSFIQYLKIVRTDGRPIYDDDGVLDVRWWKNGIFTESDEVVNYAANLHVKTQVMPYNFNGFFGTVLNAKYQSGATINITWDRGQDPEDSLSYSIHDKNANIMGSGNYRNNGVNPGREYYQLCDMHYCNSPYVTVDIQGTGYWENGWWGGSYDHTKVNAFISGFMPRANRDWTNNLTTKAIKGTYRGKTAYYFPKNYDVVATNLNNYVKINGVQTTPKYGTSVVPFKDGHHIAISNEGYTLVEIENGSENVYTPYYCFVDTILPDIEYVYHNSNALENRTVGMITTNANGAKSQTIVEGHFKDQVQVNFSVDLSKESPETATYTFNGITNPLSSGTWFNEEGSYTITITDKAGNTTISKFTIDKSAPSYNMNRLQSDTNYKIAKWYLVDIPYGYSGYGSYSFATYNDALSFACNIERQNTITEYYLDDIKDFTNTHLVASGNSISTGPYWYYKSKDSPNLYVYYFNENSLNEVISHYANKYVSKEQVYKLNSFSSNNYGNTVDKSIYWNIISSNDIDGYVVNDFIFRYKDDTETYKIYYDYQEDDQENWKELVYDVAFKQQVNSHGLYKIKEMDFVGNETTYYVYLDLLAPMLDIEAKIYGKDKTITQTISNSDIPINGELVFYYESFKIINVIEDYKWWCMEIKCPDGNIARYTYLDELPNFESFGSGEFTVTISDRVANDFKFKVYILGKAPTVEFQPVNSNSQLKVTIKTSESYNTLTDLKIYRNGICLNSDTGYDEFLDIDTNEIIFINANTKQYLFSKGGIYIVEITDNFGRTLSYEYKFEKDLPKGVLIGVDHNGKTKNEVKFIYDSNKYFAVVVEDEISFTPNQSQDGNMITLIFTPKQNEEHFYSIKLLDKIDNENYNIYNFTIRTIKPIINLFGVENGGTTGGNVYATWETNEEQYTAFFILNSNKQEYKKGQVLSVEGNYEIILIDEIGNQNSVTFEIDKTINFKIADKNGTTYNIDEIKYINFDIRILNMEPLTVTVTKNNSPYEYEFGLMITEEASYLVRLNDQYGNSFFFSFEIDKTAPQATLYGVENFGTTSNRAWVTSLESNITSWYVLNEVYTNTYKLGTELKQAGKYKLYVADRAKNYISFEFEIDNEISFDINTYYGGISNGGVRVVAYENLKIIMYKNGKAFDYNFEQILNDEGEYSFTLIDDFENKTSFFFNIITKKKQNLNHILQENISITSILKNEENFEFEITDRKLYLHDEGYYKVFVKDTKNNKEYSFEITLDTTPPTLELVNVENGGSTKKLVSMKNVSENPYTLLVLVDGVKFEYKLGEEIEKCGRFEVILTDEAGNQTTYNFERVYSLNGPSIAILAGLGALVVLLIILLVKSRHHYYKDEVVEEIEEEIDETNFEDDENKE